MGDALQILLVGLVLLVVLLVLSAMVPPFKSFWEGFFSDYGQHSAQRLRVWRAKRKSKKVQSAAASFGSMPVPASARALSTLEAPHVIAVGTDPAVAACASSMLTVEAADGESLIHGLREAISTAAEAVRRGEARTIAVVVGLPVTGSWSADAQLDLASFFAAIFEPTDCDVWLSYEEPIDVSPWPAEVFLETSGLAEEVIDQLVAAGFHELSAARPLVIGNRLRLSREQAARALLLLTSDLPVSSAPPMLPPATSRPAYASYLSLALNPGRAWETGATTYPDREIAVDLQRRMHEQALRVIGLDGGPSGMLPLTPYRGAMTAWRPGSREGARRPTLTPSASDQVRVGGIQDAERAIDGGDARQAAEALAHYGRSWIETPDAAEHTALLRRVEARFANDSEAALWAHYLLALDAALRVARPDSVWVDDEACARAAQYGPLGTLFEAERMEFTRLRGDLATAVEMAADLAPRLDDLPSGDGVAATYASATSKFVLGNVLRAGGRFDLARQFIDSARAALDEGVPSHAVEAMHCRYATAVCDAMDGLPRVEPLEAIAEGHLVFARSLVTLTNAQAAWFVNDLERAAEFASQARDGFEGIGYGRHAKRAQRVGKLVDAWAELTRGRRVTAMPTPLLGEALGGSAALLDLSSLRPSAALTVLHFATTFATDPTADREVHLPAVIDADRVGHLALVPLSTTRSIASADEALRRAMGIGPGRAVPLMPE